jgi:hypothetical protein
MGFVVVIVSYRGPTYNHLSILIAQKKNPALAEHGPVEISVGLNVLKHMYQPGRRFYGNDNLCCRFIQGIEHGVEIVHVLIE